MKRVGKTRLFVLLFLLIAGGCTETHVEEDDIPLHALKEVDAGFILNVLANRTPVTRSITFTSDGTIESDTLAIGAEDSVRTKAVAPLSGIQESQIASLWVGQYDVTTGMRLFNQYIPSMTGTTVNLKLKQSQAGSRSRVYFVSNAGDLGAITTEAILKKHTLAYISTPEGLPDNNLCKMMGYWEGEVTADGIRDIGVELTRLIATITFTYSIGADFTFRPASVVLKNAPTVSQVEAPTEQLTTGGISYNTYTGTVSQTGTTVYWYLPENMAGTVSDANAVDSEKKKTGQGVTNATCIELTGTAVQGGVTYGDVTFRFYPGSDKNNYDIVRNSRYTMDVTLIGIDISDERITVGEIPPIEVDPTEMPAKKGGEKDVQITARPGQPWVFDMPAWLSALLDGQNIPSGATITHQGPANVIFRAVEANPRAESRSVSFNVEVNGVDQEITIVQAGSTLTKGDDILLDAEAGSEGASSFTATEGLQWLASLSGGDWLNWSNSASAGPEAPADAQPLKVKSTTSNPFARVRSGKITMKAGTSVGDVDYTNLIQEIKVLQMGSIVTGSTVNMNAEAVNNQVSTFTATVGLDWVANVTNGNWISLTGTTSGYPTTGNLQNITFDVSVNPSSTQRSGEVVVRAGDVAGGPTGTITVNQLGSNFSVSDTELVLAYVATSGSVIVKGTNGLLWTVSPAESINGITPATISQIADGNAQVLNFDVTENIGTVVREAIFTVAVTNGDHSKRVRVKQKARVTVTIDQSVLQSYSARLLFGYNWLSHPPFDADGTNKAASHGITNVNLSSSPPTMTGSYTIQIQEGQNRASASYSDMRHYCDTLTEDVFNDWRLPTQIELHGIYQKVAREGSIGASASAFISNWYWSSSVYLEAPADYRCVLTFGGVDGIPAGAFGALGLGTNSYVRCVRDIQSIR